MTTTESTERDIRDAVSALWPALTPVIITHEVEICHHSTDALLGYSEHTTYGMIVGHKIRDEFGDYPQRFIVIRDSADEEYYLEIAVGDGGEFAMYSAWMERDGVTEAFPSDPLAAYESNEEAFGDLLDDLVTEGALLPVW